MVVGGGWMNARGQVIVVLYIGTSGKSNSGKNARGMENYLLSAETYPKICETKVVQNMEREGVVEQMPRLLQEAKPSPLGPTLVPPWVETDHFPQLLLTHGRVLA